MFSAPIRNAAGTFSRLSQTPTRSFHQTNLVSLHDALTKTAPPPLASQLHHPSQPLSTLTFVDKRPGGSNVSNVSNSSYKIRDMNSRSFPYIMGSRPLPASAFSPLKYPVFEQMRGISKDTAKNNLIPNVASKKKVNDNELHNMRYTMSRATTPDFVRYDIAAWKKWNGVPREPTGKRSFSTSHKKEIKTSPVKLKVQDGFFVSAWRKEKARVAEKKVDNEPLPPIWWIRPY